MKLNHTIGLLTVVAASLGLLAPANAAERVRAETPPPPQCGELFADLSGFATLTAATGKFSPSTGEMLTDRAGFVPVYLEGFDGKGLPGLGPNPQNMFIFTTTKGRVVVRFLNWVGPY